MITKEDRENIIQAIGKNYTTKFLDYCHQNGILGAKGNPYDKTMVSKVLNQSITDSGISNEKLENHLFEFAYQCILKKERDQDKRKKLAIKVKDVA